MGGAAAAAACPSAASAIEGFNPFRDSICLDRFL